MRNNFKKVVSQILLFTLLISNFAYPFIANADENIMINRSIELQWWGEDHKITICHIPPWNEDNPQTIEVDEHWWGGHDKTKKNHIYDHIWACESPDISVDKSIVSKSYSWTTYMVTYHISVVNNWPVWRYSLTDTVEVPTWVTAEVSDLMFVDDDSDTNPTVNSWFDWQSDKSIIEKELLLENGTDEFEYKVTYDISEDTLPSDSKCSEDETWNNYVNLNNTATISYKTLAYSSTSSQSIQVVIPSSTDSDETCFDANIPQKEPEVINPPVQTWYNEDNDDPYSTPHDPDSNELACTWDTTYINGISVHWTEVAWDNIKYQRQYKIWDWAWTDDPTIYSTAFTQYLTFWWNPWTPWNYSSRVRAFKDMNDNGSLDEWELYSEWSNVCEITFAIKEEPTTTDVTICKQDQEQKYLTWWNLQLLWAYQETVQVPTNDGNPVYSSVYLQDNYVLVAKGTYKYRNPNLMSDANYSERLSSDGWYFTEFPWDYFPWLNVNKLISPYEWYLWVTVNGTPTNWSEYFAWDHIYAFWYPSYSWAFDFRVLDDWYGDNVWELQVDIYKWFAWTTWENGCVTFKNVPFWEYEIAETLKDKWENVSWLWEVNVNIENNEFTVVNKEKSTIVEKEPFKIVATKIICENEADLPNNLLGQISQIDGNTAIDWVNSHTGCSLAEWWNFQYGINDAVAPDWSFTWATENDWWYILWPTNSSWSVEFSTWNLDGITKIKVREVLQDGYIPFTNNTWDTPDVTAEIYCGNDVAWYDNEEWITDNDLAYGNTVYCVAWNAPKPKLPDPEIP